MEKDKDKAQTLTTEEYSKKIQTLEEKIAALTVSISQKEREIEQKEIESLSLLKKGYYENKDILTEQERKDRVAKIREICDKERDLDKEWEALRLERDALIRDLRILYINYIKASHKERDEAIANKKKGIVDPAVIKAASASTVNGKSTIMLERSSLVTGTSQAGVDDMDFNRIFKKWEFSIDQLTIDVVDKKKDKKDDVVVDKKKDKKDAADKKKDKKDVADKKKDNPADKKKDNPADKKKDNPVDKNKDVDILSTKGPTFMVNQGTLLNKEVCIKTFILNDEGAMILNKKMQTEYKKLKEQLLGHPNLLAIIGYIPESTNHKMAIIVELARNKVRSLQDVLNSVAEKNEEKRYKLGFQKKLYIAKCVTAALSWLHENLSRPIVHSRLKPSNILFTRDWKVKVSDYGIGLPQEWLSPATREEVLFNEKYAHYSAPEIFTDNPQSTPASDAWSLGMIFYTLLTDKIPYAEASNYNELKELITTKKTPTLPENTPPKFKDIIMKCWDHNPQQRTLPKDIAESDPWDSIFQQASLHGKEEAKKIWDQAVKGDTTVQNVNWSVLGPIFWDTFKYPKLDASKENCIKHLIRVAPNGDVTFEKFSAFASTFSPFRVGDLDGPAYINDIIALCKEKWFYGLKARGEAEALLNCKEARGKDKKFPFLVRLSDTKGYQFCISYISLNKAGKEEVLNLLIAPKEYENEGFLPHLRNEIKKRNLEPLVHTERPNFLLDSSHKPIKVKTHNNAAVPDSSFLGWSSTKYVT